MKNIDKLENNIVLITNIPAPYREQVHEIVNKKIKNYTVVYVNKIEPNREWKFELGNYNRVFLTTKNLEIRNKYFPVKSDIIKVLNRINPDVVITSGFSSVMLRAFFWANKHKAKHIAFTDGTLLSESNLSKLHKIIRKYVYNRSDAFIGASLKSISLFKHYAPNNNNVYQSHLCIDNQKYFDEKQPEKKYDIMFSGQFIPRKMPFFFIEVAEKLKKTRGTIKVLLLGSGLLKEAVIEKLQAYNIDYDYPGFIENNKLPKYYKSAKLFLCPTRNDPWGIVANEACAAGVPVISCENAGVANELIINDFNGYILPLEVDLWVEKVNYLLNNQEVYKRFSENAKVKVAEYNFEIAAEGIVNAAK